MFLLMMTIKTYEQNLDIIKCIGSPYYIYTQDVALFILLMS